MHRISGQIIRTFYILYPAWCRIWLLNAYPAVNQYPVFSYEPHILQISIRCIPSKNTCTFVPPPSPLLSIADDRVQAVCCGEPLSPGGGQSCSGGQGQGRAVLQVRKRKRETKREGNWTEREETSHITVFCSLPSVVQGRHWGQEGHVHSAPWRRRLCRTGRSTS